MGIVNQLEELTLDGTANDQRSLFLKNQLHAHLKLNFELLAQGHDVIKALSTNLTERDMSCLRECAGTEYPLLEFDWGTRRPGFFFVWIRR